MAKRIIRYQLTWLLESIEDHARTLHVIVGVDGNQSGNWSGDSSQFWMPGEYSRKYANTLLRNPARIQHDFFMLIFNDYSICD